MSSVRAGKRPDPLGFGKSVERMRRRWGSLSKTANMTRLAFQKDHFGPSVEQGPANYGLWDKSGPPPVFVNKVLLEHSQAHSFVYCLRCFPIAAAGRSSCDGDHWAHRAKHIHHLALYRKKKCWPLVWRKGEVSPEVGRPVRSVPGASRVKTERRSRGRDAEGVELSGLSVWRGTKDGCSEWLLGDQIDVLSFAEKGK